MSVKLGVLGSTGRTGSWVQTLLAKEYAGKAELAATAHKNQDLSAFSKCDVVIDFSTIEASLALARELEKHATPPALVIGTTGWKIDERRELEALGAKTPVLMGSNFSTGVLAMLHVLRQSTPLLEKLGYTPVIVERHHKHKKDSPSGTAISFQRAISPAGPGNVQTHSIRAGEVIGDHEATFHGPGDHMTFGHFAQDRSIFARGAIEAALWLAGHRSGASPLRGLISVDTFFKERYL